MLTWIYLRQCAVARHAIWCSVFEGSDRKAWKKHRKMIRAVYGW
jgi:hypothetical protein